METPDGGRFRGLGIIILLTERGGGTALQINMLERKTERGLKDDGSMACQRCHQAPRTNDAVERVTPLSLPGLEVAALAARPQIN